MITIVSDKGSNEYTEYIGRFLEECDSAGFGCTGLAIVMIDGHGQASRGYFGLDALMKNQVAAAIQMDAFDDRIADYMDGNVEDGGDDGEEEVRG